MSLFSLLCYSEITLLTTLISLSNSVLVHIDHLLYVCIIEQSICIKEYSVFGLYHNWNQMKELKRY